MKIKNEYHHRIQKTHYRKILVRLPSKQHLQMKRGTMQFWHFEIEFQDITKELFSKAAKPESFSFLKIYVQKLIGFGFQH